MTHRVCALSTLLLLLVPLTVVDGLNEIRWDNLETDRIDLPEDNILRFVWGDTSTSSNANTEDTKKQPTAAVVELTPKPDEVVAAHTTAGASDNTSITPTDITTHDTDVAIAASQAPSNEQDGAARRQRRQEITTASPLSLYNLVSGDVGESVYRFSSGAPTTSGNITISLAHLVNTSLTQVRFFCENHPDIELIVQLPTDLERDPGYGQSKMALGHQNKLLSKEYITIYASVGGVAVLGLLLGVLLAYSRRRSSKDFSISRSGGTKTAASIDTDTLNKDFALEPVKAGRKPMLTKKKKSAVSVIDDIRQAWQKKENNSKSEPYRLLEILRSFREQQHAAMKEEEERRSQSAEVQKQLEAKSTPDIAVDSNVIEQQQQPAPAKARRGSRLETKAKTTGATLGEVQITTTDSTESTSGKLWQNMTVPDIQKTVQQWKRESVDVDDAATLTVDPSSELKESADNITAEFSFQSSEQEKAAWLAVQDAWQEATSSSCESDENEEMRTHPASEVFDFDEDSIDVKPSTTTIKQQQPPRTTKAGPVAALQKRTHQSRLDAWSLSTGEVDSSSSGVDSATNSSDNDTTESSMKTIKSPLRRKSREHKSPMKTGRVTTRMSIPQESASSRLSWSLSGGGDTEVVEVVVPEPRRSRKFSEDITTPLPFMIARARLSHDRASYDNSALCFKKNDLIQVFKKQPKGVWEGAVIKSGQPTSRGSFPFTMVDIVPASKYSAEIKALEKQYTPQSVLAADTALPMRVNPLFSSDSPQQAVVDDGADE